MKGWVETQVAETTRYLKDKVTVRLFVTGDTVGDEKAVLSAVPADSPTLEVLDEKHDQLQKPCRCADQPFLHPHDPDRIASPTDHQALNSSGCGSSRLAWNVERGRPDIPTLLADYFDVLEPATSVGIVSCGPATLTAAVRRGVAARQRVLVTRPSAKQGPAEVELHTEEFDW